MIRCPSCESENIEETGVIRGIDGEYNYYCNDCGLSFYSHETQKDYIHEKCNTNPPPFAPKNPPRFNSTKEVPKPKRPVGISQEAKKEIDYFLNKLKGALMYVGGNFENYDFDKMTAYDLIDTCFRNGVRLDCLISKDKN